MQNRSQNEQVEEDVRIELPPLPDDFDGGKYVNHIMVAHAPFEFIIDFWQIRPETRGEGKFTAKAHFIDRVILSPFHVKALVRALQDNISSYEKRYGVYLPDEVREKGGT